MSGSQKFKYCKLGHVLKPVIHSNLHANYKLNLAVKEVCSTIDANYSRQIKLVKIIDHMLSFSENNIIY